MGSGHFLVHSLAFYVLCGPNYLRKSSLKSCPLIPHDQKALEFLQFWASFGILASSKYNKHMGTKWMTSRASTGHKCAMVLIISEENH